jgi:hypothetical protein
MEEWALLRFAVRIRKVWCAGVSERSIPIYRRVEDPEPRELLRGSGAYNGTGFVRLCGGWLILF